jgi:hypothetical protein
MYIIALPPAVVGEEVEAEIAVEQQHREGRGQDRKGRDDQQVGGQRGPAEHRHAHIGHAGRAHLQDGRDEVDAGQQRADAGDLQRPQVIVDADAGENRQLRQRRIGSQPVRANSPTTSETLTSSAPDAVSQKLTEFSVGKATSRTPSCSGTTKFISPITNGIATKKIMIVPCAEKIWS